MSVVGPAVPQMTEAVLYGNWREYPNAPFRKSATRQISVRTDRRTVFQVSTMGGYTVVLQRVTSEAANPNTMF